MAPVFEEYTLDSPSAFVECPLCSELFSKETIEVHAAVCMVWFLAKFSWDMVSSAQCVWISFPTESGCHFFCCVDHMLMCVEYIWRCRDLSLLQGLFRYIQKSQDIEHFLLMLRHQRTTFLTISINRRMDMHSYWCQD